MSLKKSRRNKKDTVFLNGLYHPGMHPVFKSLMSFLPSKRVSSLRKSDSLSTSKNDTSKSSFNSVEASRVSGVSESRAPRAQSLDRDMEAVVPWNIAVSIVSRPGKVPMNPNKVNQDRVWVLHALANLPGLKFFGCADGHGVHGHDVAEMIMHELPIFLTQNLLKTTQYNLALTQAYSSMALKLASSDVDSTFSGSTCVSVLLVSDQFGRKLICANVGDSRAVLGGLSRVGVLSNDHKPDLPIEKKRILARRGRVSPYLSKSGEAMGPARVWLRNQELPGLAMSRSFGDSVAATVGVISEPEIIQIALEKDDKVLIIATDGVWEFISSDEALAIIQPFIASRDSKGAAELLCQISHQKWKSEEECIDDISCIIAFL